MLKKIEIKKYLALWCADFRYFEHENVEVIFLKTETGNVYSIDV